MRIGQRGVVTGDDVEVDVEVDTVPRMVVVPRISHSVSPCTGGRHCLRRLSYSRRRELVLSVESAKKAETRVMRIEKVLAVLREMT